MRSLLGGRQLERGGHFGLEQRYSASLPALRRRHVGALPGRQRRPAHPYVRNFGYRTAFPSTFAMDGSLEPPGHLTAAEECVRRPLSGVPLRLATHREDAGKDLLQGSAS